MTVHQLARYQVRPGSVEKCVAAIKRFSEMLYLELVEPVEFVYYRVVAEKKLTRSG